MSETFDQVVEFYHAYGENPAGAFGVLWLILSAWGSMLLFHASSRTPI